MAYRRVRDRGKWFVVIPVIATMFGSGCAPSGHGTPPTVTTISNAKQVALGTLMYSVDWDDRYPLGMSSGRKFQKAVNPYVKNSSVFRSRNPAGGTFVPNPNLAGVPTEGVENFEAVALLFETFDWPDGKRVVAFADTHAEFVAGFDAANDLEVELTEDAQKIVDEMAQEQAAAPPATGALGMPGN